MNGFGQYDSFAEDLPSKIMELGSLPPPKDIKILAWDNSASNDKSERYIEIGKKFLRDFKSENEDMAEDLIYLLWDTDCKKTSFGKIMATCHQKRGNVGKIRPSKIIPWIGKHFPGDIIELWIITDGTVPMEEVNACGSLNMQLSVLYSKVKLIVIDFGLMDPEQIVSVGAGFFNNCEVEIFLNEDLVKSVDTSRGFDYDSVTKYNFEDKWEELSDYIKYNFMGSLDGASVVIDSLNDLKTQLLDSSVAKLESNTERSSNPFQRTLDNKVEIYEELKNCQFYRDLFVHQHTKIDISISALIKHIQYNDSYGFESIDMPHIDQPKGSLVKREEFNLYTKIENVKRYPSVECLKEETPVLLLTEIDLIDKYWTKGSYDRFCMMLDCPLFANIEECSVYLESLVNYREWYPKVVKDANDGEWTYDTHPITTELIYGGLVLSEDDDHQNDALLYQVLFQGKKVSTCLPLWYYVIWKRVKDNESIPQQVRDKLKEYALLRIKNAEVPLAMSTHPTAPQEIVPIHIAFYYCTEGSSALFAEEPELFLHERLRVFHPVADDMLDILQGLQKVMDVDKRFVQARAKTFQMLSQLSRTPHLADKRYFLLQEIFETTPEGFLTYQIKNPTAFVYLQLLDYDRKSMIPFFFLEYFVDFRPFTQLAYDCASLPDIKLCEETCRPFFVVEDSEGSQTSYFKSIMKSFRKVELDSFGQVVSKDKDGSLIRQIDRSWIPYDQLYIELTSRLEKFPSWEEYVEYCRVRMRILCKDQKVYLHSPNMSTVMRYYFDLYSNLNVPTDNFIKRASKSVSIEDCVEMEGVFNGTDVKAFIQRAKSFVVQEL